MAVLISEELSRDTFTHDAACRQIAATLGERGWCVTPDFAPPLLVDRLRSEVLHGWQNGDFRPAGVGRGKNRELKPDVRSDWVRWLDPAACSAAQARYLSLLEQLRQAINETLFLGVFDVEVHQAVYPPGTWYHKHLDQFRDMGTRCVSCILYLNDCWQAQEGGQLRLYTDSEDPQYYEEILPLGGQLVTFMSARYLHEVMPASRSRMSITGWYRTRS